MSQLCSTCDAVSSLSHPKSPPAATADNWDNCIICVKATLHPHPASISWFSQQTQSRQFLFVFRFSRLFERRFLVFCFCVLLVVGPRGEPPPSSAPLCDPVERQGRKEGMRQGNGACWLGWPVRLVRVLLVGLAVAAAAATAIPVSGPSPSLSLALRSPMSLNMKHDCTHFHRGHHFLCYLFLGGRKRRASAPPMASPSPCFFHRT
jgi:hypothetical protein